MSAEAISAVVGFILPPFIDIVNTKVANTKVRFIISLVVSLVIGLVTVALTEGIDIANASSVLLAGASAFTTAQITYKQYYENSKARTGLKKLVK